MSLVIINRIPEFKVKTSLILFVLKRIYKKVLSQKRGPQLVTHSLLKGLKEMNYQYKYNPKLSEINKDDVVYVNESIEALQWAIEKKKKGNIKKLIAGPAITVLPNEANKIMLDSNIDVILQPSKWVKDYWVNLQPELSNKIFVWAAGVDEIKEEELKKDNSIIVYKKGDNDKVFSKVINLLEENKTEYTVLYYGKYKQISYLNLLKKAKGLIYLGKTESQGLSLLESWMYNVPTLVYDQKKWEYNGHNWNDDGVSAPYLIEQCGMFFTEDNLKEQYRLFMERLNSFKSREYALDNFTHKKITKNFINIINK